MLAAHTAPEGDAGSIALPAEIQPKCVCLFVTVIPAQSEAPDGIWAYEQTPKGPP